LEQILKYNVTVSQLLQYIPDEEFASLIKETGVDYSVKKVFGKNLFYLLLYGLLETTRVSNRSLEDVFKSNKFKLLFNLAEQKNFKYNTISTRLSKINCEFFERIYHSIYEIFSREFGEQTALKYKITRVDSSMVCEAANKLAEGMVVGKKKDGKKQVKYTIGLTGLFPSSVEVFTQQAALSEDITIPKVILKNIDKKKDNVFVFDRGVSGRKNFDELNENDFRFVTRINPNSRHSILKSQDVPENLRIGNLDIISDDTVYLSNKYRVMKTGFRLIKTKNENNEPLWFTTNDFELSIEDVIHIYKLRWDIEVFFRFLKQELNFSHFLSTNTNGIKVVLYMTLISAMLILVYKKYNELGYKTAKRRFFYELEDMILEMAMIASGGNPKLVFR
jgi:transposase